MMLQTMIVKNGPISINDQYARTPRQANRIVKTTGFSSDAARSGD
jgi:hypothetical protein